MNRRPITSWARLGALALAATGAAGCVSGGGFDVRVKRDALDLVFEDPAKAAPSVPPPPRNVVVPVVPDLVLPPRPRILKTPPRVPPAPPPPVLAACPSAPEGSRPERSAKVFVTEPPGAGRYTARNDGRIVVTGVFNLTLPYPRVSSFDVRNVQRRSYVDQLDGPIEEWTYDLVASAADGSVTSTTYSGRYRTSAIEGSLYSSAGSGTGVLADLRLLRQEVTRAGGKETFQPSPPVTVFSYRSGTGTTWTSAGVDTASKVSLSVQGEIREQAAVDVCGDLVDTYVVATQERITDLTTGYTQETDAERPNLSYVATNLGGLLVKREIHTVTNVTQGVPTRIVQDYTSVLRSTTPQPVAPQTR